MIAAILISVGLPAAMLAFGLISGRLGRARLYRRCEREARQEMRSR